MSQTTPLEEAFENHPLLLTQVQRELVLLGFREREGKDIPSWWLAQYWSKRISPFEVTIEPLLFQQSRVCVYDRSRQMVMEPLPCKGTPGSVMLNVMRGMAEAERLVKEATT